MADKIKDVVDNLKIRKFREIGNGTISRVLEKETPYLNLLQRIIIDGSYDESEMKIKWMLVDIYYRQIISTTQIDGKNDGYMDKLNELIIE